MLTAAAAPPAHGPKVLDAWARETTPGAAVGAAYFRIVNDGVDDALVRASSPVAEHVELHASRIVDGMMQMRPVDVLDVPAGHEVVLRPGELHAMLVGLRRPLRAGERIALILEFRHAGQRRVEVDVHRLDEGAPHEH